MNLLIDALVRQIRLEKMAEHDKQIEERLAAGKIDLTPTGNTPELTEVDLNPWLNSRLATTRAFRRSAQERFRARRRLR